MHLRVLQLTAVFQAGRAYVRELKVLATRVDRVARSVNETPPVTVKSEVLRHPSLTVRVRLTAMIDAVISQGLYDVAVSVPPVMELRVGKGTTLRQLLDHAQDTCPGPAGSFLSLLQAVDTYVVSVESTRVAQDAIADYLLTENCMVHVLPAAADSGAVSAATCLRPRTARCYLSNPCMRRACCELLAFVV